MFSGVVQNICAEISFQISRRLEDGNFIKKGLQHRYFPVNLLKCLGTSTLYSTSKSAFSERFLQNSKKNTSNRILILVKFSKNRCLLQVFSCQSYEVFQNSFYITAVGGSFSFLARRALNSLPASFCSDLGSQSEYLDSFSRSVTHFTSSIIYFLH